MSKSRPIRILLGMLGTDVHNKGIRTLATLLRDHGMDVIYLGEHNTVPGMVNAIVSEDADIVGLSFSSAAYMHYTQQLLQAMQENGVGDVPVILGGLIHPEDETELRQLGVRGLFGPGATTEEIVEFINEITD